MVIALFEEYENADAEKLKTLTQKKNHANLR